MILLAVDANSNPIFRDVMLLLVSFVMILGTLYLYFRLRTVTFRRTRKLLEERVEVKTKQLSEINMELEKLSLVASQTDNSVIIASSTGEIEWVNDGFMRMIGGSKDVIGKKVSEINIYQNVDNAIEEVIKEKRSKIFESQLPLKGREEMWISSTLTPIFGEDDKLKKLLFVDTNITESKKLENKISGSLREKEVLLKEIHHRVKNNLQIIISLLNLQSGYIKDEQTLKAVKEGQNRVRSMALVHEKFYQADDLSEINFGEYAEKLCGYLRQSYGDKDGRVQFVVNAETVTLDMDNAMPCGLLINEVVSNALKYAFPGEREGEIRIEIKKLPQNRIELSITDNGIGLPPDLEIDKSESLGLQLIIALAQQLDGELKVLRDGGTKISVTFTYPKH